MKTKSIAACALALAVLALSGRVASAQNRGYLINDANYGQLKGRLPGGYATPITEQDRQATRVWFRDHEQELPVGWRQRDRLSSAMQERLQVGMPLDADLREEVRGLPVDLTRGYGTLPAEYRCVIIGGNIVLLNEEDLVYDIFPLFE